MKSTFVTAGIRAALAVSATVAVTGSMLLPAGIPAYADDVRGAQWHLDELQVDDAHRHSRGDTVVVAVVDSGVDASHPDLRDNVLPGAVVPGVLPESARSGQASDGREDPAGSGTALAGLIAGHGHEPAGSPPPAGRDPDAAGEGEGEGEGDPDADDPDSDDADSDAADGGEADSDAADGEPEDDAGEDRDDGSGPAGVGSAGVLGLAPAASILPVVVAAPGAAPDTGALAAGIAEAVRLGADVICVGRTVPDDPAVTRAIGDAVAAGVVVVVPGATAGDALARYGDAGLLGAVPAAAGGPGGESPSGPAPEVVAVPADGVLSTGSQGGYYRYGRTAGAAASAVLAGAVALVLAAQLDRPQPDPGTDPGTDPDVNPGNGHSGDPVAPEWVARQAAHRVRHTAPDGSLDLVAALTAEVPVLPAAPDPAPENDSADDPPAPPAGPERVTEPGSPEAVAAFDSGDWRRWLVAVPLLVFVLVVAGVSIGTARRAYR